ncbi:hypothetical protein J2Z53_001720 [Clostridium moniliforme]|uniref:Uncharacterized protein n=1 Tax=Clostridium moniliforme TaxID=39489 RepID=A0ABS4F1L7_9CLOT|nr:hypothetical protein [Clostridium moniliforme]
MKALMVFYKAKLIFKEENTNMSLFDKVMAICSSTTIMH